MEGSKAFVCRSVSRSCAHVSRDTTEDEYIKLQGISDVSIKTVQVKWKN